MIQVKKQDGRTEPFIPEKLIVSAIKSGATPDDARMMARQIESKLSGTVASADLRSQVLSQLRQKNARLEENWLVYDRAVKRR
jgi:transcriptional repressor NrdR